ncbi:hypothetical protein P3T43_006753 [Paraburkholderia sp. GAS41]|jgi:hypothetical protein
MSTMNSPLRVLVARWLGSDPTTPTRVIRFGYVRPNRYRYVCVETQRPAGPLTIYFFLHKDGVWSVYPPEAERPAMSFS